VTAAGVTATTGGRKISKVVPTPTVLLQPDTAAVFIARYRAAIEQAQTGAFALHLGGENRSKTRAWVAASMPQPSSATANRAYGPGRLRSHFVGQLGTTPNATVIVPWRPPMAWEAFTHKFISTCWSCPASAMTGPTLESNRVRIVTEAGNEAVSSGSVSATN